MLYGVERHLYCFYHKHFIYVSLLLNDLFHSTNKFSVVFLIQFLDKIILFINKKKLYKNAIEAIIF